MKFSFEDGFECIDEALQEVKAAIFKILKDPFDLIQPDWTTQLHHVLECYNMAAEEEDEDLRNINIQKAEEAELKFPNIGDYWDDATVDKVTELLCEYQDLFPMKFSDLKGIIGDLGVMKITLKPDAKPIKQMPYRLDPKYKEKVCLELDKILAACIIEPIIKYD
eukprot:PITA_27650